MNVRKKSQSTANTVDKVPRMSKKAKRIILIVAIVLFAVLLLFAEVIRPDQDAKAYTNRLETASGPLDDCFQQLADTTKLDIYYAPDISVPEKQKDVASISKQIKACQTQLDSFNAEADNLLNLHFAGYTRIYHQARVNQHQAYDIIGQSDDVLNQYTDLANSMSQYLEHISVFLADFDNLQKIETAYPYSTPPLASRNQLAQQALDLHSRANALRNLDATADFGPMKVATADMFDGVATGFDNTAKGYTNYSDYYKNLGFKQVDDAVALYDAKIINMPFDQLKGSYVPKQVQQLPVKIRNLLAAQSE